MQLVIKMVAKYLNLGCGNRYVESEAWLNVDFAVRHPRVLAIDLRKKLPFHENYFDLVYHSHVLEHFTCTDAKNLLDECYRILKPGGIIRIVVPDLENIVREYLHILDEIRSGVDDAQGKYNWIMLELYDQAVRQTPGGMMLEYLQQSDIPARDYVLQRGGKDVQDMLERAQRNYPKSRKFNSQWHRLRYYLLWRPKQWIRHFPTQVKHFCAKLLLGKEYDLFNTIHLRNCGEIHQWMYDAYSLEKLLKNVGFIETQVQTPTNSYLDEWQNFNLDTEPDGSIYKPNSLYMEARKIG